jgi:hypothetical protein
MYYRIDYHGLCCYYFSHTLTLYICQFFSPAFGLIYLSSVSSVVIRLLIKRIFSGTKPISHNGPNPRFQFLYMNESYDILYLFSWLWAIHWFTRYPSLFSFNISFDSNIQFSSYELCPDELQTDNWCNLDNKRTCQLSLTSWERKMFLFIGMFVLSEFWFLAQPLGL